MVESNYKEIVDQYFKLNQKHLLLVAIKLTSKLNKRELHTTLLTECYMYIIENETKLYGKVINDGLLEAIVINWMSKQVNWSKTNFKRKWILNNRWIIDSEYDDRLFNIEDDSLNEEDYLRIEDETQNKINLIKFNSSNLDRDNRNLWLLYMEGINTSTKLSRYTGLSRTTCYNLLKNLKEKLKNPLQ